MTWREVTETDMPPLEQWPTFDTSATSSCSDDDAHLTGARRGPAEEPAVRGRPHRREPWRGHAALPHRPPDRPWAAPPLHRRRPPPPAPPLPRPAGADRGARPPALAAPRHARHVREQRAPLWAAPAPDAHRSAGGVLAVLSCWLPEVLVDASPARLRRYRDAYATVDLLYAYSRNQQDLLRELLGLDADRVRPITFGVDHEELRPAAPGRRDRSSRSGATGAGTGRPSSPRWRPRGCPAQILAGPSDLGGLDVPTNVEVLGLVDRTRYRALLQQARGVLVATRVMGYPSGQSVLLEAMACGRPVIATSTPALDEYLDPGRTALVVPAARRRRLGRRPPRRRPGTRRRRRARRGSPRRGRGAPSPPRPCGRRWPTTCVRSSPTTIGAPDAGALRHRQPRPGWRRAVARRARAPPAQRGPRPPGGGARGPGRLHPELRDAGFTVRTLSPAGRTRAGSPARPTHRRPAHRPLPHHPLRVRHRRAPRRLPHPDPRRHHPRQRALRPRAVRRSRSVERQAARGPGPRCDDGAHRRPLPRRVRTVADTMAPRLRDPRSSGSR